MQLLRSRHLLFSAVTAVLAIGLVCAGAEILVRASGREPWRPIFLDPAQPVIYQPDSVLGWRHKEGEYRFPAFSPLGKAVRMRFEADAGRATGAGPGPGSGTIATFGCSFTEGFAIADHETYAWTAKTFHRCGSGLRSAGGACQSYPSTGPLRRAPVMAREAHEATDSQRRDATGSDTLDDGQAPFLSPCARPCRRQTSRHPQVYRSATTLGRRRLPPALRALALGPHPGRDHSCHWSAPAR
jgi:hypothetical protein